MQSTTDDTVWHQPIWASHNYYHHLGNIDILQIGWETTWAQTVSSPDCVVFYIGFCRDKGVVWSSIDNDMPPGPYDGHLKFHHAHLHLHYQCEPFNMIHIIYLPTQSIIITVGFTM